MRALIRDMWLFRSRSLVAAGLCVTLWMTGCKGGEEGTTEPEVQAGATTAQSSPRAAAAPPQSFASLDETLAAAASTPSPASQQIQQATAATSTAATTGLTGRLQKELVLPPVPNSELTGRIRQLLQIAVSAQEKADYGPAREFFEQALGMARQQWPANHWRVRDIELAIAYQEQLASFSPEQTATIREATRLHMLAYQRASQNEFEAALEFLGKAQALRVPVLGESHMTCIRARSDQLQWTIRNGDFAAAQSMAASTLQATVELNGEVHPETALLQWAIGDLQLELGKPAEADHYYQRALAVLLTAPSSEEDYPQYLLRLSNIYQTQSRYLDAEQCMLESAEIRRQTKGETSREYVGTLMSLGTLYLNANQHALADAAFSQVVNRTQGNAELATLRATVLVYLGRSAIEQGDLARAARTVDEALTLREATSGRRDAMYAGVLFLRADIHMRQGQYAPAVAMLHDAARVYEALGRAGLASHSACVHRIVLCELEQGDVEEARHVASALIRAHKILLGEEDPIIAGDKALEARVLLAEGNAVQAEAMCREAVAALAGDPNQLIRHSFCLHALGDTLAAQGRSTEAAQQIEAALSAQRSLLRVADLHMLYTTESYAATLHELGRDEEAAGYEAQAALFRGRVASAGGSPRR